MHSILNDILIEKRRTLEASKKTLPLEELKLKIKNSYRPAGFKKALLNKSGVNVIAEVKKASPSVGIIEKDFNPAKIAKDYGHAGATAISVLTEEKYFQGNSSYIGVVKENGGIPVLRKDFLFDIYQVYESAFYSADALLLIAATVDDTTLKELLNSSKAVGIDCLVEVHDQIELDRVLEAGAEIIGINNRNLNDFSIDLSTADKLIPKIGKDKLIVVESGIKTRSDIERYLPLGVNTFLIGESLMKSSDKESAIRKLRGN